MRRTQLLVLVALSATIIGFITPVAADDHKPELCRYQNGRTKLLFELGVTTGERGVKRRARPIEGRRRSGHQCPD